MWSVETGAARVIVFFSVSSYSATISAPRRAVFTSREKSGSGNQFCSGGSVNKRRENVDVFEEGRKTTTWQFSQIKKQNDAEKI